MRFTNVETCVKMQKSEMSVPVAGPIGASQGTLIPRISVGVDKCKEKTSKKVR